MRHAAGLTTDAKGWTEHMDMTGLPNSFVALVLMSEAGFGRSTVFMAAAQLERAKTDPEKDRVLARQVELLKSGISEADFRRELEK